MNILLVEDEEHLLAHLAETLAADTRFLLAGQARTYAQAESSLSKGDWDVVLLDLLLEGQSSLDLVAAAANRGSVLVYTVYGNEETVIEAVCAGAAGYLVKTSDLSELGDQIAAAHRGETPISAAVAGYLFRRLRGESPEVKNQGWQLTDREVEVLGLLARGYTYREVAAELYISFNTVAFHTKQIYEKLRVNSRSAAVFQAVQDGIISI